MLAICHWILDLHRWRGWSTPFAAFGRNPLSAYFLSVVLDNILTRWKIGGVDVKWTIYSRAFASWAVPCCGAEAASLFYALGIRGALGRGRLDHATQAGVHRDLMVRTSCYLTEMPAPMSSSCVCGVAGFPDCGLPTAIPYSRTSRLKARRFLMNHRAPPP